MHPLLYLLLLVVVSVLLVLDANRSQLKNINSQLECNEYSLLCALNNRNCCGLWEDKACMKGKRHRNVCVPRYGWQTLVLAVLWFVLAILFVLSLFMCGGGREHRRGGRRHRRR